MHPRMHMHVHRHARAHTHIHRTVYRQITFTLTDKLCIALGKPTYLLKLTFYIQIAVELILYYGDLEDFSMISFSFRVSGCV